MRASGPLRNLTRCALLLPGAEAFPPSSPASPCRARQTRASPTCAPRTRPPPTRTPWVELDLDACSVPPPSPAAQALVHRPAAPPPLSHPAPAFVYPAHPHAVRPRRALNPGTRAAALRRLLLQVPAEHVPALPNAEPAPPPSRSEPTLTWKPLPAFRALLLSSTRTILCATGAAAEARRECVSCICSRALLPCEAKGTSSPTCSSGISPLPLPPVRRRKHPTRVKRCARIHLRSQLGARPAPNGHRSTRDCYCCRAICPSCTRLVPMGRRRPTTPSARPTREGSRLCGNTAATGCRALRLVFPSPSSPAARQVPRTAGSPSIKTPVARALPPPLAFPRGALWRALHRACTGTPVEVTQRGEHPYCVRLLFDEESTLHRATPLHSFQAMLPSAGCLSVRVQVRP
ncbi:hypothetical protein DFH09DRAFT_1320680 [Mycena vulgaris]|nr:hypothetical protein DFH09DRAFT_1320680 [Mycena vulgaris]